MSPVNERSQYSYVRRRGRTTGAQAKALEQNLADFSVALSAVATQTPPKGIEIGFGMGDALLTWAQQQSDWDLLGIDLYLPGVGSLVNKLKTNEIKNVRVCVAPAQEVVRQLPDSSVHEIRILFPDPWPKKRHAKRRLIQTEFVQDMTRVLAPCGALKIATDWEPYADWIREVVAEESGLEKVLDEIRESHDESQRSVATKFEQRGQRLGHRIHDLVYQPKNSDTTESR